MYVQVKRLLYNGTVIGFLCHIELQSTCDQMVLTDISNCVLNVLYVRNIALNKVNYSHSSWAFNPPPTNKKAHRKKTKHLYIYFSVEEILELMNMNKKSQTLIWREKKQNCTEQVEWFWAPWMSRAHIDTWAGNFYLKQPQWRLQTVALFFKRNAQSEGPRLVVTWRQAAIIPHLKCRVFKMCLTGKLLMGVTHHIASTKPRSVHQQSLFSANQHPPDGTSKSV